MSGSVVERYVLAQRVADRYAASLGDPAEYLAAYSEQLVEFSQFEEHALRLREQFEEIINFKNTNQFTTDPAVAAERMAKLKAMRAEIPDAGPGAPIRATMLVERFGFTKLKPDAYHFCYAVIQQLVLPQGLRRSIEAAAKFWDKSARRFRPKAKYSQPEEFRAEYVDRYLEDLELFRKYEKLFERALAEGKAHSHEGEGATTIQAGPFKVVNTGGFPTALMVEKAKLVAHCADLMSHIGLGKICYGDVLITNRISAQSHTQAFYHIASDEMFVRADGKVTMDGVHAVCHELAHRYHYKVLGKSNQEVNKLYNTLKLAQESLPMEAPQKGETLTWKGESYVVDGIDWERRRIKMKLPSEPDPRVSFFLPLSAYTQSKGSPPSGLKFVTGYAEKGGPGENFAEMVAFYAMGKLPSEQVELLKPLL